MPPRTNFVRVPYNKINKYASKAKKTIFKKKNIGLGKKSIIKLCQSLITKNIENKTTISAQALGSVCVGNIGVSFNPTWYVVKDWQSNVWNMAQGTGQGQRVGNKIKVKRWILKGQIMPHESGQTYDEESAYLSKSYQGYLTIYFGRRTDGGSVDGPITQFLQSGNTAINPLGSTTEMMLSVNKDLYKVYWRKTFKMGQAWGSNVSSNIQNQTANNDFALTRTFGFDVCKYILKNRILKFNDTTTSSTDRDLSRLAIWAVWRPAIGSLANPNPLLSCRSFYDINLTSYGEYEDA